MIGEGKDIGAKIKEIFTFKNFRIFKISPVKIIFLLILTMFLLGGMEAEKTLPQIMGKNESTNPLSRFSLFSSFKDKIFKKNKQNNEDKDKIKFIRRDQAKDLPYSLSELMSLGKVRTFEGEALREIAFPLGGIGTGTISLGGRGNLRDWEIFNRPGKGINLPFTFFALYYQSQGEKPLARVLEGPLLPPFSSGHGLPREMVPGLPRMGQAIFRGEYPLAQVQLRDQKIPLQIFLEAFNPFIPGEPEQSGIPAILIRFRVKNLGPEEVRITVVGSFLNPLGFDGEGELNSIRNEKFGENVNEIRFGENLTGLFMTSRRIKPDSPAFGNITVATPWKKITYLSHWVRGEWWDDLQIFWDDLADDGRLQDLKEISPSPEGRTDIGSLGLMDELQPGEEAVLPFIISWYFPIFLNYFDVVREQRGKIFRNHYAERFSDSWQVAEYFVRHLPELEKKSELFRQIFFSSSLPPYVLEAISSQMATIRTATCFWLEGGHFFAFEGCSDRRGCCPLNCTHVWNYAQALAFLFPGLERSMRETDFLHNTKDNGEMVFRTSLPLGSGVYWNFKPAADGQLGRIISLYRDWQLSGDFEFLRKLWPKAKKALEYAWIAWDKDRDGLLESEQHNTYDIEFYGPNSMLSSFYLGALLAGSKMAEAMGEKSQAKEYQELLFKGQTRFNELLWNGEYYIQKYEEVMTRKYQYGEGCLSDQLLGQWLAMVAGLGRFLPQERIKQALNSIFKYNFLADFSEQANCQRTYALQDERGLLLCSWPRGGRPSLPFVYSDEVWTGIEYQVASHLLFEGMVEEGLTIVKALRDRYDGRRRNPWNEVECGHHYARAMSSWALLLALTGFSYSGVDQKLSFAPLVHQNDFRTFWSVGTAWGNYFQKIINGKLFNVELSLIHGSLSLKEVSLELPPDWSKKVTGLKAKIKIEETGTIKEKRVTWQMKARKVTVRFLQPLLIKAGETLFVDINI